MFLNGERFLSLLISRRDPLSEISAFESRRSQVMLECAILEKELHFETKVKLKIAFTNSLATPAFDALTALGIEVLGCVR